MEALVIWVAIASIVSGITGLLQVVLMWFQLRELGDLDHDRRDWFEHLPWRKYRKDE